MYCVCVCVCVRVCVCVCVYCGLVGMGDATISVSVRSGVCVYCGYDFRLNSNSSRMITPGGEVVPRVRDPGTGFHFMVDHFRCPTTPSCEKVFIKEQVLQSTTNP